MGGMMQTQMGGGMGAMPMGGMVPMGGVGMGMMMGQPMSMMGGQPMGMMSAMGGGPGQPRQGSGLGIESIPAPPEELSEPKVLLRPDLGGGLSVSLIFRFGVLASTYNGASAVYLVLKNCADQPLRCVLLGTPAFYARFFSDTLTPFTLFPSNRSCFSSLWLTQASQGWIPR